MAENYSVKSPRLCFMVKEDGGYGFNLHGEKGVVGQYISAVDKGSAALRAGLCIGDRVIEVNGVNVETATHSQVVAKIKENPTQVHLLVVDRITDQYLQREGIAITAELSKYETVFKLNELQTNGVLRKSEADFHSGVQNHRSEEVVSSLPPPRDRDVELKHSESPAEAEQDEYAKRKARHGSSIASDDSVHLSETERSRRVSNDSNSSSLSSDKPSRTAAVPKRKQVKEQKTNWKAKAEYFNNL